MSSQRRGGERGERVRRLVDGCCEVNSQRRGGKWEEGQEVGGWML